MFKGKKEDNPFRYSANQSETLALVSDKISSSRPVSVTRCEIREELRSDFRRFCENMDLMGCCLSWPLTGGDFADFHAVAVFIC